MSDGEIVIDQFSLTNCIATGTQSQIWEVAETGTSNTFAMKLLLDEAFHDKEQVAIIKQEAKIGKMFEHPNFVTVHEFVKSKTNCFFIMDYFRAPNLGALIANDLPAAQSRFAKLVEGCCMALGCMHDKGWVHRDVKPDNVLFNRSSELRLIDFSLSLKGAGGLSKMMGGKLKTIEGTRTYIAPETIMKKRPTFQTDIYSLGILFYEVLTGSPPFHGMTPTNLLQKHIASPPPPLPKINDNLTPEVDRFVQRMLAKKPANRHADVNEVFSEFRSIGSVFHEDVLAIVAREQKQAEDDKKDTLNNVESRLNSRADHERSILGIAPPPKPKRKRVIPKDLKDQEMKKAAKAAVPAAPQQPQPVYPQQPMPMQPQMMPPGMPMQPPPMIPGQGGVMPPGAVPYGVPPVAPPLSNAARNARTTTGSTSTRCSAASTTCVSATTAGPTATNSTTCCTTAGTTTCSTGPATNSRSR